MRRHLGHGLCIATAARLHGVRRRRRLVVRQQRRRHHRVGRQRRVDRARQQMPPTGRPIRATQPPSGSTRSGRAPPSPGRPAPRWPGRRGTTVAGSTGTTSRRIERHDGARPDDHCGAGQHQCRAQTSDELVLRGRRPGPAALRRRRRRGGRSHHPGPGRRDQRRARRVPDAARRRHASQSIDEELGFASAVRPDGVLAERSVHRVRRRRRPVRTRSSVGTTRQPTPTTLAAPSGLDVGSTWAEFADVITVDPGRLLLGRLRQADGITLALQSSGTPFVDVDDDGNETDTTARSGRRDDPADAGR